MNTARAELGAVKLEELRFDNRYARLPPDFYTRLSPTPLPDPYLVAFNPAAADLIGLARAEAECPPRDIGFVSHATKLIH